MIILIVPLFLIIIVIRIFYSSSKTSYIKAKNYTPKFDYEIQAEMKRKVSEEKKEKEDFYKDAEFINKECTCIENFIINDEINTFDLRKLADLNNIQLQIPKAWYPITIKLIKELNNNGWNKEVYCIKEKYATLEFYTNHGYEDTISEIIRGYGYKSQTVCQTCGEKGEIRHSSGWDYVACRKHYLKNRGKITFEDTGFNYEGTFYNWEDIKDRSFENLNHNGKYNSIILEFNKIIVQHAGWSDNKLYISKDTIGFGNLLNYLSKNSYSLKGSYIRNFENIEFCEICGYQSVYFDECECCENSTWTSYLKRWGEKNSEEKKQEYINHLQIDWVLDEGELYEVEQKNYVKNPNYKILFTEGELKDIQNNDF